MTEYRRYETKALAKKPREVGLALLVKSSVSSLEDLVLRGLIQSKKQATISVGRVASKLVITKLELTTLGFRLRYARYILLLAEKTLRC